MDLKNITKTDKRVLYFANFVVDGNNDYDVDDDTYSAGNGD